MIPPQLALFAAKHSKKLILVGVFLLVLLGIKMALSYHERVVEENATLREQISTTQLGMEVEQARGRAQAGAIQQWKDAHNELQQKLAEQKVVQKHARAETEKLNETFRDHDLTRLAAAKPGLIERRINAGTARIQRLLVCASAGRECDDSGHRIAPGTDGSAAPTRGVNGRLQVDGDGAGVLQEP